MTNPKNRDEFEKWFSDKPQFWAPALTIRASLRTFPSLDDVTDVLLAREASVLFRALIVACIANDEAAALHTYNAANAAYLSVQYVDRTFRSLVPNHTAARRAVTAAAGTALRNSLVFVSMFADAAAAQDEFMGETSWEHVIGDVAALVRLPLHGDIPPTLAYEPLWKTEPPTDWQRKWRSLSGRLKAIDPNFDVWIEWFQRRVDGQRSSFNFASGDQTINDRMIFFRLINATNEDFWGKGHEYVNATLKGWLDEARLRVAPPVEVETEIAVPSQEPHAIAYGVNKDWMLDRLPHSDQTHLRDLPNQRRAYADLRETALELQEEGQRLGPRLQPRIERAVASLPEKFEEAEAWPVWRDFNALRRLFRAHQIAFANPEPDAAKLEPVIAEALGGLLDIYNNFAFADDGLRAKDENRISPQERSSAEAEAFAAIPVINAIRNAGDIATDQARADIIADTDDSELPSNDPYDAQVLDQANRTRRNWLAGAFEGARRAMANPKIVGKAIAIGVVGGAAGVVGKVAMTGMVGLEYGPLLQFIATNAAILQNYAAVAFSSYPQLNDLIERISVMWKTRKSSSS